MFTPTNFQKKGQTNLQPVVQIYQSAALQVQLVHDADIRSSVGDEPVRRLQALVLRGEEAPLRVLALLAMRSGEEALVPEGSSTGC